MLLSAKQLLNMTVSDTTDTHELPSCRSASSGMYLHALPWHVRLTQQHLAGKVTVSAIKRARDDVTPAALSSGLWQKCFSDTHLHYFPGVGASASLPCSLSLPQSSQGVTASV